MRKGDSDPATWTPEDPAPQPPISGPLRPSVTCRHEVDHNLEDEFHGKAKPKVRRPPRLTLTIPRPASLPHLLPTTLPYLQRHQANLSPISENPRSPTPVQDEIYWSPSPSPPPMSMSPVLDKEGDDIDEDTLIIDLDESRTSSAQKKGCPDIKRGSVSPEPSKQESVTIKQECLSGEQSTGGSGGKIHVKCIALQTLLGDNKRPASPTMQDLPKVIQSHGATPWEIVQIMKASHHYNWNSFQQKVLKAQQAGRPCSPTSQLLHMAANPPTSPQQDSEKQLRDKVQMLESEKKEMADRIAALHTEVLTVTDNIRTTNASTMAPPSLHAVLPSTSSTTQRFTSSTPPLLRQSLHARPAQPAVRWATAQGNRPRSFSTNSSHSSSFAQVARLEQQGNALYNPGFNFQAAVAQERITDARGFDFMPPIGFTDRQQQLEQVVQNHQESLLRARAELDGRIPAEVESKVTHLFPLPFDLEPKPYQVISSNIKLYHITQQEVRNIEYRLALTYRIGLLLFECLKEDPLFVTLARMNSRSYEEQEHVMSTMLSDFMPVRNMALLTHFIKDKFGNVHPLTESAINIQIFSQISKFSYPIQKADSTDFSLDLLKVPRAPMFEPKGWFPALPALPPQGTLFTSMTSAHSSGRAPLDPFKYVAWIASHNMDFGKALIGPLFDSGSVSQILPFIFQPSIYTVQKGGGVELFPAILRVLRLHCFNLASRVVDCTLAKSYVSNANLTKAVFLRTNLDSQSLFSDLIDDPFNIQFSGWAIPSWMETFGPQAKTHFAQRVISLLHNSMFHISRPASFSVEAWNTLKPSDGYNKAYNFVMQRERWIQSHLLSHEPLLFVASPYAQFVPTKTVYWIHYDH